MVVWLKKDLVATCNFWRAGAQRTRSPCMHAHRALPDSFLCANFVQARLSIAKPRMNGAGELEPGMLWSMD